MSVEMTFSRYWDLREKLFFSDLKDRKKVIADFFKLSIKDIEEVILAENCVYVAFKNKDIWIILPGGIVYRGE